MTNKQEDVKIPDVIIFTFTLNPKTKAAAMAGNIDPLEAAQILQHQRAV